MTPDEARRLLAAAKTVSRASYRVCRYLLGTGFRADEAAAALCSAARLDGDSPRVLVVGGKKRDPRSSDDVLITPMLAAEIAEWIEGRPGTARLLAPPEEPGARLHRQWIWSCVKAAVFTARLNPLYSPHTLRHRFATDMAAISDGNYEWVKRQLRHASAETVARYIHAADIELKSGARIARLEELEAARSAR